MKKVTEKNFRGYEAYALVTGAASGMGRLYCLKLAARGYNIIMVDINGEKLEAVGDEVRGVVAGLDDFRAAYKDRFRLKTVVQDLALTEAAAKVAAAAEGCEVEVLINNAGIMYVQTICGTSRKTLSTIALLMSYTPLMMCREFVPQMLERGNGYVLNVSSLAAWMIWPAIGMYGVTKRFIKDFSRELRIECRGKGVSVTNAYFGAVDTPLIPLKPSLRKLARNLRVMIDADVATDKALKATFRRRKGTMPGFVNKIFKPLIIILPEATLAWALNKFGKYLLQDV